MDFPFLIIAAMLVGLGFMLGVSWGYRSLKKEAEAELQGQRDQLNADREWLEQATQEKRAELMPLVDAEREIQHLRFQNQCLERRAERLHAELENVTSDEARRAVIYHAGQLSAYLEAEGLTRGARRQPLPIEAEATP